jgi:hypothetical protein
MIPWERGISGLSLFIIFYSRILVLVGKIGYMRFLGKAMWCFIACNYINLTFGMFGGLLDHFVPHSFGYSFFIITHSSFMLALGLGMGNELWEEKSHCLLGARNY